MFSPTKNIREITNPKGQTIVRMGADSQWELNGDVDVTYTGASLVLWYITKNMAYGVRRINPVMVASANNSPVHVEGVDFRKRRHEFGWIALRQGSSFVMKDEDDNVIMQYPES